MAHPMRISLPTAYFEDEPLLGSFDESYGWTTPSLCAPHFSFPQGDPFPALAHLARSFRMPSPPVSPASSLQTPNSFVSLAHIAPQPQPSFFAAPHLGLHGGNSAVQTLRARGMSLKRPASPSPTPSLSSTSSSPAPMLQTESTVSSANAAQAPKRARTQMSSKDFVPPDVSGLSKREARLVKNRAAAFLSRQRKREEFEELEKHCQDLERENARLRAGAGHAQSPSKKLKAAESESDPEDVQLELERLRESNAQLIAQNAQLSAENAHLATENARLHESTPKLEDDASSMLSEPMTRRESKDKHNTGSVALMVLMISLSLLGKPLASGVNHARGRPSSMALHHTSHQPSSTFDYVLPRTNSDCEWLTSPTDLEYDDFSVPVSSLTAQQPSASQTTRTLTVQGLENLDIPTEVRDFTFEMDVDEQDGGRNVVLAVSNSGSTSSDAASSSLSSPSSASISTLDSAWPEPSVDSTMAMLGGDYMSFDYDTDFFAASPPPPPPKPATRKMTVAVVSPRADGHGRWSVEVKENA